MHACVKKTLYTGLKAKRGELHVASLSKTV